MAWERGERGRHFSRGGIPEQDRRDLRDEDADRHYRHSDYDEEDYPRHGRPFEGRRWRGNEYDAGLDSFDRGRNDERYYNDERDHFIDSRHRQGFLRGESAGRHESEWTVRDAQRRDDFGQQDRWSGPYAGRGPKGYRRSDGRIYEEVCERLMEHPSIDASDIEVSVNDADVTLAGQVDSRAIKHLSEVMAETVSGVKEVHNQLRVTTRDNTTAPRPLR